MFTMENMNKLSGLPLEKFFNFAAQIFLE